MNPNELRFAFQARVFEANIHPGAAPTLEHESTDGEGNDEYEDSDTCEMDALTTAALGMNIPAAPYCLIHQVLCGKKKLCQPVLCRNIRLPSCKHLRRPKRMTD
jgi:hypothetical protein